jgi:hypothetical protein
MNYNFNINRFGRLLLKHTAEHYKNYLMALAVLIGVLVLGGCFLVYMLEARLDRDIQGVLYGIMLFLSGTIFTSTAFADLGERKKAVSSLTLQASHFEKYLVEWIYSLLIFLIVYTVAFYLSALFILNIKPNGDHVQGLFNVFDKSVLQMILIYAFLHSVALFGAIYFEKLHFIKTTFVFFIALGLLVVINKIMLSAMLGRAVLTTPPFGTLRYAENGQATDVSITGLQQDSFLMYLIAALALIFWIGTYWRLKEKQI